MSLPGLSEEQRKTFSKVRGRAILVTESLQKFADNIAPLMAEMQQAMEKVGEVILELVCQYRMAIQEGITNFESPDKYDPSKITINPCTKEFAIKMGISILDDLPSSHFSYLYERYENGLEAYFVEDYQKAIFTFLSCLDGILKEFCRLHREDDCRYDGSHPGYPRTFNHFMEHYKMDIVAGSAQFRDRIDAFFEHRHQIMHGDRYAYFDENIATISLLFLSLVFGVVSNDISS